MSEDTTTVDSRFFLCYVETTRRCNLECPYCMSRLNEPSDLPEMTTDELKHRVLDELARVRPGAAVAFSGGETLLRDDHEELFSYAADLGLYVFLNTNGLLINDLSARRLKEASRGRLIVVLPLNSIDDDVNKWTRDDSVRTVLDASAALEREDVDYFFLVTASSKSASSFGRTMEFLQHRQVPVLRAPFVPRGGGCEFPELALTKDLMKQHVHPALMANPLSYISYTPFFASPEKMNKLNMESGARIEGLGCQAGRAFAAVSTEGQIAPCVQLLDSTVDCGNVRDVNLGDVLNTHPIFKELRTRENYKGKCGRCRYRSSCGGCRALAHYHNDDILAEDPTCFFEPVDKDTQSEFEEQTDVNVAKFLDYLRYNEPWNELFGE